ncbi:MAG TPA: diguanylate cyclase, partial [archaeon]|nr:diguanylate cyclase [archaeon]
MKPPFTLAYIDVDKFKSVNDQFGHTMGDQVLRTVARSVKNLVGLSTGRSPGF